MHGRLLIQPSIFIAAMVDNLCRGSRCGGVCREVPVGDLCPSRADGREFGATDVARGGQIAEAVGMLLGDRK